MLPWFCSVSERYQIRNYQTHSSWTSESFELTEWELNFRTTFPTSWAQSHIWCGNYMYVFLPKRHPVDDSQADIFPYRLRVERVRRRRGGVNGTERNALSSRLKNPQIVRRFPPVSCYAMTFPKYTWYLIFWYDTTVCLITKPMASN